MKSKISNEIKANLLLRRVYNVIEMSHLNDLKLSEYYSDDIKFPKRLGNDIFNYLQAKDETFRKIVISRQKRYRKKMKKESGEQNA